MSFFEKVLNDKSDSLLDIVRENIEYASANISNSDLWKLIKGIVEEYGFNLIDLNREEKDWVADLVKHELNK